MNITIVCRLFEDTKEKLVTCDCETKETDAVKTITDIRNKGVVMKFEGMTTFVPPHRILQIDIT